MSGIGAINAHMSITCSGAHHGVTDCVSSGASQRVRTWPEQQRTKRAYGRPFSTGSSGFCGPCPLSTGASGIRTTGSPRGKSGEGDNMLASLASSWLGHLFCLVSAADGYALGIFIPTASSVANVGLGPAPSDAVVACPT